MIAFLFLAGLLVTGDDPQPATRWWDSRVEASLDRAPAKKAAWEQALEKTRPERRAGMAFLMADLPLRDLESLPPDALAANLDLAYQARDEVPWGPGLPEDVFLDAVLPHASVTEPRDSMRAEFHDRYLPLVKELQDARRGGARDQQGAIQRLQGRRTTPAGSAPTRARKESIAQGMATCTGLSIMLVEACRAVGVPARMAGIASWPGRGGNHTWVEVWDDGWHFVGAAEPDEKGLDHAWFVGDAAKAIKAKPANAIYAVTYRPTGELFPLAWNPRRPGQRRERHRPLRRARRRRDGPDPPRLMVEVRRGGQRVEADVTALDRATGEHAAWPARASARRPTSTCT